MAKKLIPSCGHKYNQFFLNIVQYVGHMTTPPPVWTHIPEAEVTALNDAYALWYAGYARTLRPHLPADTAAMHDGYNRSKPVLSRFIQVWFRGFPDIVTAEHLLNMGIPPIDHERTDTPCPTCQPEADVVYPGRHLIELAGIRKVAGVGNDPPGVDYGVRIFWGIIAEPTAADTLRISAPPEKGGDLPHSTFTHRKKYRFNFEGDSGKTVWFSLRYENRKGGQKGEGPFGPLFSAIIP
ncbi:MAG: hypothetical protein LBF78_14500 [Treponema sp.]|nr:hypothetical protein [Treponema sp.]